MVPIWRPVRLLYVPVLELVLYEKGPTMSDVYFGPGIGLAANWLRAQGEYYPEDIFSPPPPASEQTDEQKNWIACGGAAMARHICSAWPDAMIAEYRNKCDDRP